MGWYLQPRPLPPPHTHPKQVLGHDAAKDIAVLKLSVPKSKVGVCVCVRVWVCGCVCVGGGGVPSGNPRR